MTKPAVSVSCIHKGITVCHGDVWEMTPSRGQDCAKGVMRRTWRTKSVVSV